MNFEILYSDRHTEIMNYEDTSKLVDQLEMFERTDVSQIHRLKDDGDFDTIWTEEEGLFVRDIHDYEDNDDDTSDECDSYPTDLLNKFYTELFSTDFRDCDSPTENAKTDYIFDYDNFEDWLDMLIKNFVETTNYDETQLRLDIKNCQEFVEDMKTEYNFLFETCYEDDE